MLEQIIVVLDSASVSFCHYENPAYASGPSDVMPREVLASIIDYAATKNLMLNVLFGRTPPPDEHVHLLEKANHVKIVPFHLRRSYADSIVVFNWDGEERPEEVSEGRLVDVIVRMSSQRLGDIRRVVRHFKGRARRVNITFTDLQQFTEQHLIEYEHQLAAIEPLVARWYLKGETIELSCLSDRLLLNRMNNCEAGVRHVTFAPNGKFYICPGFYHSSPRSTIGSLETGISIPNPELLDLEHAPICSHCDAFQCRRCIYLNKVTTRELNTPSRQQCVASHVERNASRRLLRRLKPHLSNSQELADIPELDYLDPLERVKEERPTGKIELRRMGATAE